MFHVRNCQLTLSLHLSLHALTGPEYGTMEGAWKGILTEAERLADVHSKVKENLIAGEVQQIRSWQKDNYQKVSTMSISES